MAVMYSYESQRPDASFGTIYPKNVDVDNINNIMCCSDDQKLFYNITCLFSLLSLAKTTQEQLSSDHHYRS